MKVNIVLKNGAQIHTRFIDQTFEDFKKDYTKRMRYNDNCPKGCLKTYDAIINYSDIASVQLE